MHNTNTLAVLEAGLQSGRERLADCKADSSIPRKHQTTAKQMIAYYESAIARYNATVLAV